jgi:DNA-binding LytR/AlgR family response regulator
MEPLVLIHSSPGQRRVALVSEICLLEAEGEGTWIHLTRARRFRDQRRLGELMPSFERHGFVRVHRNHAVSPDRVTEIRRRQGGQDWELRLEVLKNRVVPISRNNLERLWQVFGE